MMKMLDSWKDRLPSTNHRRQTTEHRPIYIGFAAPSPMGSFGNHHFNTNWRPDIAGASCQVFQQAPFTSQPFLPQLMHNLTVPALDSQQNYSDNRLQSSQNSTPRTFFPHPTSQLSRNITGTAPDFQQNHSDNRQQSSQVASLQDTDIRIGADAESSIMRSANQQPINSNILHVSTVRKVLLRTPNGNQPTSRNSPGSMLPTECYQLEPQTSFDHRTFFTPPQTPTHGWRNMTVSEPDFQQNHSDNRLLSSQITALQDDYESRIRELNQEIFHLKSSEQEKLFYLEAHCAKLNDELLKKELAALKCRLEHKALLLGQEKRDLEAQCTKLNDELLKKDCELEDLKASNGLLESQALTLGREKKDLESECTKLNDELLKKRSELKALNDLLESQALLLGREKKDLEAQCAKLNDVLLKKDIELKASNDLLVSQTLSLRQEKYDLEVQCANLNDELLKKYSEVETLKQFKVAAQKYDYESKIRQLNQEICNLKSSEQHKFLFQKAKWTKLNDELIKKNTELEALNDLWNDQERKCNDLQKKLGKVEEEHRDLLYGVKRYKDKFIRAQKEKSVLMKKMKFGEDSLKRKKLSEDSYRNYSFQISELQRNNKKLEQDYEVLRTNLKADLDESKSRIHNLQSELNQRSAKLLHCEHKLAIAEEENRELKQTNERISRESEEKLSQMANENEANTNAFAKLSEIVTGLEIHLDPGDNEQVNFESCIVDLEKEREDKNAVIAERDRLEADLKKANETIEVSVERSVKFLLELNRQDYKCKEYIAEIKKLKQDLAQSQNLKGALEIEKKTNERLSGQNKEFEKEAKQLLNKFFVGSSDGQGSSDEQNEDGYFGPTTPKKKKIENS
ncbi:hypothetical protein DdX_14537 [Ditylenchus destructor]|uniref:Uncharacterized protein n=1 Tax=Ditylenchus destructor TaxID=166010 RepID=A0AAD4QVK0_9BILA|nr:hypothetical protein DdX_14537 [Ditylenchus destructor]